MTKRKTGPEGQQQEHARHHRRVQRLCEERGLQMSPSGASWRIHGPGIDVRAADLSIVTPEDLDTSTRAAKWD